MPRTSSLPLLATPDPALLAPAALDDDRGAVHPGIDSVLIVEDDPVFAKILLDAARENGFTGVVTLQGSLALALAREIQPQAVLLDLSLPDADGWTVLELLKQDPTTRHIPVHILSGKNARDRALRQGAISYLVKPVTREQLLGEYARMRAFIARQKRRLLIVEDDPAQRDSLLALLAADDLEIRHAEKGAEALGMLRAEKVDCVVLDLVLPDISGFELLQQLGSEPNAREIPVVVYTGKELTRQEVTQLRRVAQTVIVKDVRSPERLLDETALFLHRRITSMTETQQKILGAAYDPESVLRGRKVLIVDDDVRNIFALTTVLERYGMEVVFAENGRDGIDTLHATPGIDIVLMDIMMPEMDGYDTTRAIRAESRFKTLPIITLTAKAMKGDREKCLEAGASDYITKPVDTVRLLSMLRIWLSPRLGAAA